MSEAFEYEDVKIINSISKRRMTKPLEQIITNKKNDVMGFIIDDFMMDTMWDIYWILKQTRIARTTKRQVDTLDFCDSKSNIGNSLTFSLGDFKDGELDIRCNDEHLSFIGTYDTKFNPIYFDGSKLPHEVRAFEGTRYSVVCYRI